MNAKDLKKYATIKDGKVTSFDGEKMIKDAFKGKVFKGEIKEISLKNKAPKKEGEFKKVLNNKTKKRK